jgi:thiol-disulfide isomerase/thioredoxin
VTGARRRWLALTGVAAGAAALGAGAAWWRLRPREADAQATAILFGQTLPDAAGRPLPLSTFAGHPLVVNFWATWCPPCVEEMPELSALHDELAPRGLRMLGIGIDQPDKIAEFSRRHPVSYPLVVAGMGGTELGRQFGNLTGALPFTVLLDRGGGVAHRILGRVDITRLRAMSAALTG